MEPNKPTISIKIFITLYRVSSRKTKIILFKLE